MKARGSKGVTLLLLAMAVARAGAQDGSAGSAGKLERLKRYYDKPVMRLEGEIRLGDAERWASRIAKIGATAQPDAGEPLAYVEMNSPGGSLLEGMRIGLVFKHYEVATVVRRGDQCYSACALALGCFLRRPRCMMR